MNGFVNGTIVHLCLSCLNLTCTIVHPRALRKILTKSIFLFKPNLLLFKCYTDHFYGKNLGFLSYPTSYMNYWGLGRLWKQKNKYGRCRQLRKQEGRPPGSGRGWGWSWGWWKWTEESLPDLDGTGVPGVPAEYVLAPLWLAKKKYKKYILRTF